MQCKKCGNRDVRRVSVLRPVWEAGLHECFGCGHLANYNEFCGDSDKFPVAATAQAPPSVKRPQ